MCETAKWTSLLPPTHPLTPSGHPDSSQLKDGTEGVPTTQWLIIWKYHISGQGANRSTCTNAAQLSWLHTYVNTENLYVCTCLFVCVCSRRCGHLDGSSFGTSSHVYAHMNIDAHLRSLSSLLSLLLVLPPLTVWSVRQHACPWKIHVSSLSGPDSPLSLPLCSPSHSS